MEAEFTKRKLVTPKTEVLVAKETKSIFNQIILGLVIGAIAYPIFYFGVYEASKYDDFDYSSVEYGWEYQRGLPNLNDFPFSWNGEMNDSKTRYYIQERKDIYTEKSIHSSLITFLIVSGFLIGARYTSKGAKWVHDTSRKDV
jgi:hypothetical protein